MAMQEINVGNAANSKTGDPLRTAFIKINENFTELYGTDTNSKYHLGDDEIFVDLDPDTGILVLQSKFDSSMPVYIKGANCSDGGVGGSVIIEAGGAPLPNTGTTGNIELAANIVTVEANNNMWTFGYDGSLLFPQEQSIFDNGDTDTGLNIRSNNSDGNIYLYSYGDDGAGTGAGNIYITPSTVEIYSNWQNGDVGEMKWTFGSDGTLNLPESISEGNAIIQTTSAVNLQVNSNTQVWTFGTDGILTLPNTGTINNILTIGEITPGQSIALIPSQLGQTVNSVTVQKSGPQNSFWASPQVNWTVTVGLTTVTVINATYDVDNAYFSFNNSITLPVTGTITFKEPDTQYDVKSLEITPNGTTTWSFRDDGMLELPVGGDIVDSDGQTVLGFEASYSSGYTVLDSSPSGITVSGDVTSIFTLGKIIKFSILADDEYTIDTVTYDSGNDWTDIVLAEGLGGPVNDDSILFEISGVNEIYPSDTVSLTLNNNILTLGVTGIYSPSTPGDWNGTPPATISEALDRIAAALKAIGPGA